MVDNVTINLEEKNKIRLTQAIQDGINEFFEYKLEHQTITKLGYTGTKWDLINTKCSEYLPEQFRIAVCSRGIWELILIYDKETKYLYTLMKDKRFEELKKELKDDKAHYLEVITSVNIKFLEQTQEQVSFFDDINEIKYKKIEKTMNQILKDINDDIEAHVLIKFTNRQDQLFSISASIVTPTLNTIFTERWEEYIQPKYDIVINGNESYKSEEEDIELSLKENIEIDSININLKDNNKKKRTNE